MAFWIADIQRELGITILMVEHDMKTWSRASRAACSPSTRAA